MIDPTAPDPIREAHPEAVCQRCGGPNDVWSAPNDVWNAAMGTPDNPRGEGLIVCWSCFLAALSDSTPSAPTLDVERLAEALEGFKTERGEYRGITPERLAAEYARLSEVQSDDR